jgi:hypothetical protein
MISNLFPGVISPFSPHLAFFYRSVGSGLADNYVPGQTVAEMFNIPTEYPVYLTVLVPSNCLIYDSYGEHQEAGHFTYTFARSGVPGALRLDDLHPDSIVFIINHGEISGAGGDGGMGYQGYTYADEDNTYFIYVGSGGGGGRGRTGTKGGYPGHGSADWYYAHMGWTTQFNQEPSVPSPYLSLAGGDGDETGAGAGGGTRDAWSYNRVAGVFNSSGNAYWPLAENLAAFEAGFQSWPGGPENRIPNHEDWKHEGSSNYGWVKRYPVHWTDEYTPTAACFYTDIWKAQYAGTTYYDSIPGYVDTNKAVFQPQPGTAAIVLGCKTYIHNSEAAGLEGYIYGGGGGGVGGDRSAGTGDGFAGGDWGEQGGGPNYLGHDGGLGGKAVELDGNELTWVAGELQIEGDVS